MPAAAEESRLALSAFNPYLGIARENFMEDIIDKIMTTLIRGLISFIKNLLQTFR